MRVFFDHSEPIAPHIRTFWFKAELPVRYVAGQFVELQLPHDNPDERGITRRFTLSSAPTDGRLSITTKFVGPGSSTFKQALQRLEPGATLFMSEPMGDFVLPRDSTIPLVFAAGGIGITPVHSMVKWLRDTGEHRTIHVLHAVNDVRELAFAELFRTSDLTFTPVVKDPDAKWHGESGSLAFERLAKIIDASDHSMIYLSGPESMIEALAAVLWRHGVARYRIVTDYFPGYRRI